jgi:hypothetical protein
MRVDHDAMIERSDDREFRNLRWLRKNVKCIAKGGASRSIGV